MHFSLRKVIFASSMSQLLALAASTMHSPHLPHGYSDRVRHNLRSFHQNLDAGNFSAIGSLIAADYYWNYEGNIILTREGGQMALESFVTSTLNGMHARDIYNIVDGDRGAVLFRISGQQSGPFVGLPLQQNGRFSVMSAEAFTFNKGAEAREVVTITPLGIMQDQMRGVLEPPRFTNDTLQEAKTKDAEYLRLIKRNLASIHLDANKGNLNAIANLAIESTEVDENGSISHGKDAFVKLVTAHNAGNGSFPGKLFHDFDVLVDGTFGAINYVWQAPQEKKYLEVEVDDENLVRMRGMLFFEFNNVGLVTKATGVYDERVVNTTLTGTGAYLYP
ncbi:unnamed protein product [Periconia digitata]|uniref:SnoaL-like domain-containing protein n=1 Tax=Periconia digitata TaxID=1303443 RepID=A0A9W4UAX6_9PLEO|nr:unnamed protein product [Periconia digitata]